MLPKDSSHVISQSQTAKLTTSKSAQLPSAVTFTTIRKSMDWFLSDEYILFMIQLKIATLALFLLLAVCNADHDQGTLRLHRLQERSLQSRNRIIPFSSSDFEYIPLTQRVRHAVPSTLRRCHLFHGAHVQVL